MSTSIFNIDFIEFKDIKLVLALQRLLYLRYFYISVIPNFLFVCLGLTSPLNI